MDNKNALLNRFAVTPETAVLTPYNPSVIVTVSPGPDALKKAQAEVRAMIKEGLPAGGIAVELQGGEYVLSDTLAFTKEDSGRENAPVIWRAAPGQTATLSGGIRLCAADFSPVPPDDALYSRFPCPDKVRCLPLSQIGMAVPDFGNGYGEGYRGRDDILCMHREKDAWPELFLGEEPLFEARYPRQGWLRFPGADDAKNCPPPGCFELPVDDEGVFKIADFTDVHFCGYPMYDWAFAAAPVAGVDREKGIMTLAQPVGYGSRGGQRYYLTRVPEAMTEKGDYIISAVTGKLYLILPDNPRNLPLRVTGVTGSMLRLQDTSRVTFENLTLGYCRGSAVSVYGGSHVAFCGCRFACIGFNAVRFGAQSSLVCHATDRICNGGYDHKVLSCDITTVGFGAIYIAGGNRETLRPCNITVENCDIGNFSRIGRCYCFGVAITAVGAIVRNNRFHNGAHSAVWFDGNDHLIEYNEFYDLLREADDAACVYNGRDYTSCGTVVRWNFFHDMAAHATTRISVFGTYDDDNSAGLAYYGNLYYHMQGAHHSHGGHDIIVENNLVVEGTPNSIYSITFMSYGFPATLEEGGIHRTLYDSAPVDTPLWRARYPHLREYLTWEPHTEGRSPHYCSYRNNAIVRHKELCCTFGWDKPGRGNVLQDNPVLDVDVGFVDEANGDLRLRPDSPVYTALPEFQPIPFEKMGLYRDLWRK